MADKKDLSKQVPGNVAPMASNCCAEDCKKKPSRANFCDEHFEWFKAGLITKAGMKASDFDKKHYHWQLSKKKAA